MEISRGSRWIQTLRKLPIQAPKTKTQSTANEFGVNALSRRGRCLLSGVREVPVSGSRRGVCKARG